MVQDKPFMFTNGRVARASIHDGLFVYDVADACDGCFWRVAEHVTINHWATIIGTEPIKLDEDGQYICPPDPLMPELSSEGCFTGDEVDSLDEYKRYIRTFV